MRIFAPVQATNHQTLDAVVIFGMPDAQGEEVFLEIRYRSFAAGIVDGDHMYADRFEDVKREVEKSYGIYPETWRALTPKEELAIENLLKVPK